MEIVIAIAMGMLFGFALYNAGASSPTKIISMLRLQDLSLMKIIIFGIGFASIMMSIFALIGWFNIGHLSIKATNLGVVLGGMLFGIGFGTIGTCPGTCVAAGGSNGGKKAASSIIGGLTGALIFSLTYEFWINLGIFSIFDLGNLTLFNISEKFPSVINIGFEGLLVIGALFIVISVIIPSNSKKVL